MKKTIFKGAGVAIITPFTEDGVNFAELSRIIEDQIKGGTDAIVITGTSGESATMTDEEHRAAIKCAVDTVKGRIPVIAGTGSNETSYAIELSKYAEEVGADAVLVVTPYYNKCTQKGLIAHYKAANGDLSKILRLRAACGDSLDVYSGNDDQIVPILSLGGKGVISVLSNVAPKETHDMCQLYFDGKAEEAGKMQIAYTDLIDALFCEVNPIPVKVAMRKLGYAAGPLRMPLSEMEPEHEKQLETALRNHGLIK